VQVFAQSPLPTGTPSTASHDEMPVIARHMAIENALNSALWHIRQEYAPRHVHAATVRAIRAVSMLKQACEDVSLVSPDQMMTQGKV